ncbi:hypothetical protein COCSADRAFT_282588 [Bipolaris sorokiniana ND90Pr]|uniref:CcxO n=2 Tax=Cochliobolus sativus TaxID=45130 RepID=A0A4D6Q402_COCSA|nr:uncharacterized protein COCSADRAFT_282588 [Bipolaris sorokiniana ND90Pr]EMD66889.1 hypothetical protein COCSADRAFT_282588 [Bipolaris sorokiniana ND90Pr]QCF41206.1 CcxO [Bipolaris sorokiniana]
MSPALVNDNGNNSTTNIFNKDKSFWNNYNKGRPQPPKSLTDRIFKYHEQHGGGFTTAHDVGAGDGLYAAKLKARFAHVIVSDISASNVELAKRRLGQDGYSYRQARVEDAGSVDDASVDLVFAANVMHFPDQAPAMAAIARQLRPGGTFAAAAFGPARFDDEALQALWERISEQGGQELLDKAGAGEQAKTIAVMARTEGTYNTAPLDTSLFQPGAQRVHLNMHRGGLTGMLPASKTHLNTEPNHTGPDDVDVFEEEAGWEFEMDRAGVREHALSFPFISDQSPAMARLFDELDSMLAPGTSARGRWPAKIILATRR